MKARAFAPGNASCIFRICSDKNPRKMGSLGVGFTVNKGVTAEVQLSKKTIIRFNKKKISIPTVTTVLNKLTDKNVSVDFSSGLPLGMGFGLSGACALTTALAVDKLLNLKKPKKELYMIAHTAEVINRTGLGDVAGQINGGFLVKRTKGSPLKAERLNVKEKAVYYKLFGKLDTKKVITDRKIKGRINKAGDNALKKIRKSISLSEIIEISKIFAEESGLLRNKKVKQAIRDIEKNSGKASMIMLGHAVFSSIPFKGCKRLRITQNKARLL